MYDPIQAADDFQELNAWAYLLVDNHTSETVEQTMHTCIRSTAFQTCFNPFSR